MDASKKRPLNQPPPEDDEIIDLIDEVPDAETAIGLSELEQNLLELERRFGAEPAVPPDHENALEAELPDLGELEELDFELEPETPEPPAARTPQPPKTEGVTELEQHLDWLFDEEPSPPASQTTGADAADPNAVIPIAEFEEQFLEPEELPVETGAVQAADAVEEEEEILEFLDIEEEAPDEELIWFDSPGATPEAAETAEEPLDLFAEEIPDSPEPESVAPIAAADDSVRPSPVEIPPEAVAVAAAAAALAPERPTTPSPATAAAVAAAPPPLDSLSPELIEAAVEKVVTRLYSSRIESIILQAIQKAVTQEIERLKNELLDNAPGG